METYQHWPKLPLKTTNVQQPISNCTTNYLKTIRVLAAQLRTRGYDPFGHQRAQHPSQPPIGLLAPCQVRKPPVNLRFRHTVACCAREDIHHNAIDLVSNVFWIHSGSAYFEGIPSRVRHFSLGNLLILVVLVEGLIWLLREEHCRFVCAVDIFALN